MGGRHEGRTVGGAIARVPHAAKSSGVGGPASKLHDPRLRARILTLAASGMSRTGIANVTGLSRSTLLEWLARGRAEPHVEPWGSFAVDYLQAERMLEVLGSEAIAGELGRIRAKVKNHEALDSNERAWLSGTMAQRYPKQHGVSANSGREIDDEPDAAGWLQERGLTDHQLQHMLKEPPEEVERALRVCAEDVVRRLVQGGWRPSAGLYEDLGSPVGEAPAWAELLNEQEK